MPSIVPMALITLAATGGLWGAMLWAYSGRTWRFVALVPLGLPLSAAVNLLVKAPLGKGVGALAGIELDLGLTTPLWFLIFLFMLAPVFEELAKVVPVLLPKVRRYCSTPDDAFWTGLALGIGFGLGEVVYLAWQIGASGAYEQYQWYLFTGFATERLLVVFLHGFMTATFLWLAARGHRLAGYAAAVGTHAAINLGAMLYQVGIVPVWATTVWLVVTLLACATIFERIRPKAPHGGATPADVVYYSADG